MKIVDLSPEQVTAYLLQNPDFLERHIMKEIELEQLERWMIRRTQQAKKAAQSTMGKNGRKTSLSRYEICLVLFRISITGCWNIYRL